MPGAFNARRTRRRPTINITSLIDVMFLLLIFFMVSSTFREDFGIQIDLPKAATAENQGPQTYTIQVTEEGETYFGQDPVTRGQLRERLQALFLDDPEATVVLEADRSAHFGKVLEVIDTARQVGGERLIIPTELIDPLTP
jgi:biopolymer transport protein ExbD